MLLCVRAYVSASVIVSESVGACVNKGQCVYLALSLMLLCARAYMSASVNMCVCVFVCVYVSV